MKSHILSVALLVAALTLGASPSSAVTIDFESLVHVDEAFNSHGTSYSEDGFTLVTNGGLEFRTFGTLDSRFTGSTALVHGVTTSDVAELTLTDGGSFTLNSIDLAAFYGYLSFGPVSFTGDLTGGGTVSTSFSPSGGVRVETFTFSGFDSVVKVSWNQNSPFHQFDNIVASANNVPEPASLGLLGLGLAGLAFIRRGSQQQLR